MTYPGRVIHALRTQYQRSRRVLAIRAGVALAIIGRRAAGRCTPCLPGLDGDLARGGRVRIHGAEWRRAVAV